MRVNITKEFTETFTKSSQSVYKESSQEAREYLWRI